MHLLEHALDEGVTESEGSSSKAVEDGGIHLKNDEYNGFANHNDDDHLGVVVVVVAVSDGQDVQLGHVVSAQHQGQPLVVGNVLILSDDNLPGLLVKPLVVPVGVEVGQLLCKSVMFSHPDSVKHRQPWLFINSVVP